MAIIRDVFDKYKHILVGIFLASCFLELLLLMLLMLLLSSQKIQLSGEGGLNLIVVVLCWIIILVCINAIFGIPLLLTNYNHAKDKYKVKVAYIIGVILPGVITLSALIYWLNNH